MPGLLDPRRPAPSPAQQVQELGIPWLIICVTDPDEAWQRAARTELAARLNRRVYAPIRAELLQHHHPYVRAVVAEILGLPYSAPVTSATDPQGEKPAPGSPLPLAPDCNPVPPQTDRHPAN